MVESQLLGFGLADLPKCKASWACICSWGNKNRKCKVKSTKIAPTIEEFVVANAKPAKNAPTTEEITIEIAPTKARESTTLVDQGQATQGDNWMM